MPRKKVLKFGSDHQYQKIKRNKYYLVIIKRNPLGTVKPRYIQQLVFDTYNDYIKFRERFPDIFSKFYLIPTKGKDIIEYHIRRKTRLLEWGITLRDKTKYEYPTERITNQDRKSMRTKLRRQQRVWGYSLDNKFI